MIYIPNRENKQWTQSNKSDFYGTIIASKNINFEKQGYISLSGSPRLAIDNTTTGFNRLAVVVPSTTGFFAQTWTSPFNVSAELLRDAPTIDSTANAPTGSERSDAEWFQSNLLVSRSTGLSYRAGSTWNDTNITLSSTSGSQHPITIFPWLSAFAVANVNTVAVYNNISTTPTLRTTLTIPTDFMVTGMVYFNQLLYIATRNTSGGKAILYIWDGLDTTANGAFEVDASSIHDVCVFRNAIVVLSSAGELLRFNGGGFDQLDAFPVFYTSRFLTDKNNINIYKNSLIPNSDELFISFSDSRNFRSTIINQPAGIWCYEEGVGLYHKHSFTSALVHRAINPAINTTDDTLTITRDVKTGTEVFYSANTANSALENDTKYFAIRVTATTVRLATSKTNALNNTYIDFTATDGVSETFVFYPNLDYGQVLADRPMALGVFEQIAQRPEYGSDLLYGAETSTRDGGLGNVRGLATIAQNIESRGYFITPKILSSGVKDVYKLLTLKWLPLQNELDKIIVKIRVKDDKFREINLNNSGWEMTWTASNTFTTTQGDWSDANEGDEVTILTGGGAGLLAHITSITVNAGVYTVVLDENYEDYQAGDKGTAVFSKFQKLLTITKESEQNLDGFISKQMDIRGAFIQVKIEMRGINVSIEEIGIDNEMLMSTSR
jgi:hypothetical protein